MHAANETGSSHPETTRFELLLNFCRTVVRSDAELLRDAMGQYQQFLLSQQRS